ncbi:MAG TPA: triose-phosphate isomerase [Flavobacteriaceae bacterium]|jgi:triosephosphate isomerase|nr:triose-phosphate isomerase [Flavobacteriaceae bacterium]
MRKKIVAGNWKMNNDLDQTMSLIEDLKNLESKGVCVMIAPAFPFLKISKDLLEDYQIEVISQNVHQKSKGAYTGEVSIDMLKSIGISTTLIGHSERRAYFNEDDIVLFEKVRCTLDAGMNIIFCFGEDLKDRKSNKHFDIVKNQLENTVLKLKKESWENIILAYEPVWAIGTGETASPEQAQEMHQYVRNCISKCYDESVSESISILYGGSVKPSNANEIFSKKDVDGGLIGGAALLASDFNEIIKVNS